MRKPESERRREARFHIRGHYAALTSNGNTVTYEFALSHLQAYRVALGGQWVHLAGAALDWKREVRALALIHWPERVIRKSWDRANRKRERVDPCQRPLFPETKSA